MSSLKDRKGSLARDRGLSCFVGAALMVWALALGSVWPTAPLWIGGGTLAVLFAAYASDWFLKLPGRP